MHDPKVIVALDFADEVTAVAFAKRLDPKQCKLKVGKELFTAAGPACVEKLVHAGFEVFLDLKFHDIPNTVASACKAAAQLGVWMLNVHALGGRAMMTAAKEAVDSQSHQPKLIAVTVLTSMGSDDLHDIGITGEPQETVLRLARLAQTSGLDGVVCSAQEAAMLRRELGYEFSLVTPGIRPAEASVDDQVRIMTPSDAIYMGASYLVIGRPITRAEDPLAVLHRINQEIELLGDVE